MTWEIVAAFITLATALVTLGGVLARLMRTLTKLECAIDNFAGAIEDMKARSAKTHERIFAKLDSQAATIAEHAVRIHDLEHALEVHSL